MNKSVYSRLVKWLGFLSVRLFVTYYVYLFILFPPVGLHKSTYLQGGPIIFNVFVFFFELTLVFYEALEVNGTILKSCLY